MSTTPQTQQPSSTGQNAANQSSNSGSGSNTTQAPTSGNSTNQAQTSQPSNQTTTPSNQAQTNSPSSGQTQSANPPASTSNQAQSPTGSNSTNTAQQPNNQQNTADRSSNTNMKASVNFNDQQRTRISTSISHLNVQPLNNVNFSLSVGTVVPRDVRVRPLPAEVVEIVPQYRGYDFVLVKDEIVIVEPSSYKIVAVMPYSGRSTAAAPARSEQRNVTFSDRDREVIRKHAKARPVERERQTTGSTVRTEIRRGERVPDGVEIDAFPDEVYREAPSLREYRYIHRDSRTYIVEPQERRVIEEID
jgi:DNA mismatch repair ATPase MutL